MKKKAKKIFRLLSAAAFAGMALIIIPLLTVKSGITDIRILAVISGISALGFLCLGSLHGAEMTGHNKVRDKPFTSMADTPEQGRKKVYLAEFLQTKGKVLVRVPCWDIETEGKDLADAISAAREAIGSKGVSMDDGGKEIQEVSLLDKEGFFSMVDVEMKD